MQNIIIVGAGAIGSLLAARLARSGCPVTLVGRPAWREAVEREGIRLRVGSRAVERVPALRACTSLAEAAAFGPFDWLLLTTKSYSVPVAVAEAVAALSPLPPIVCFQNGIGSEEAAQAVAGGAVVAATITTPVSVISPTHLETIEKGGIGLARWAGGPLPEPLAETLRAAGFPMRCYDDARAMKWSKLLLNLIGNATSALLDWPPERLMGDPRLYELELAALAEARAVMRALGVAVVALPGYPVPVQMALLERLPARLSRPLMRRLVAGGRGGKLPSLALALRAGQPRSEVEVLNGAVASAGARLGLPTPVNAALTRLVTAVARGELPRDSFHHDPARLLDAVEQGASPG